jgi:hypothetical protein
MQPDVELQELLAGVVLDPPHRVCIAGTSIPATLLPDAPLIGSLPPSHRFVGLLQLALYEHCYCRTNATARGSAYASGSGRDLTPSLSAANASRPRWDPGWRVRGVLGESQLVMERAECCRMIARAEIHPDQVHAAVHSGASVSVYVAHEALGLQPGFYFAFGETLADMVDDEEIVRIYWHVTPQGAPRLLAEIGTSLNRLKIPFRFKALSHAAFYERADAAVLFVSRRYVDVTIRALRPVYQAIRDSLRETTCLFVKPIAPGVGISEDPGNGESFGMSRCRLVAEALWKAHARGEHGSAQRLQAVRDEFRAQGLRIEAPYLNPGSVDLYCTSPAWAERTNGTERQVA